MPSFTDIKPETRPPDAPSSVIWRRPLDVFTLSRGNVHIWRAALDLDAAVARQLGHTLSANELVRADRFHFAKDRRRFVARRGILRSILGQYLGAAPQNLRFDTNPYGKPALIDQLGTDAVWFSLSHSGGLALIAVARAQEVGVDLEQLDNRVEVHQIARRFFAPREITAIRSLPRSDQAVAFFACWTRKEAYIKARGQGMSIPLDRFEVSVSAGAPAALLNVYDDPEEATRWAMQHLQPGHNYVGALVVEGRCRQLSCWQWQGSQRS